MEEKREILPPPPLGPFARPPYTILTPQKSSLLKEKGSSKKEESNGSLGGKGPTTDEWI